MPAPLRSADQDPAASAYERSLGGGAAGAGNQPEPGAALRRARDAAMGLPLAGVILFLSPLAQAFAVDGRLFGVPVVVAYVFGGWIALILAARSVARRMLNDPASAGISRRWRVRTASGPGESAGDRPERAAGADPGAPAHARTGPGH
ncbi:MAG: hypothetical protein AAF677_04395 [Pseudomonadota bacterium]